MNTIEITDDLKKAKCGIYKILFSNGFFYIGSSSDLKYRIKSHIRFIKSGFTKSVSAKTLSKMKGFSGHIIFDLIESVEYIKTHRFDRPIGLILKENNIILKHKDNNLLLNNARMCGQSHNVTSLINSDLYAKVKESCKKENVTVSFMIDKIIHDYYSE